MSSLVGGLILVAASWLPGVSVASGDGRIVINEVSYHPGDDDRLGEFVEIHNFSPDPVDLSGWFLTGGVRYVFPDGEAVPAGGYLLVAANRAELEARYSLDGALISGEFQGSLSNDGERLQLWSADGYLVSFADYSDSDPWPETPDGLGPTLERLSPWFEDADHASWAASILVGGTPGERNSVFVEPPGLPATADSLIARGATWSYRPGTAEPPADWAAPGFDDAAWATGAAGFGYGDGDDATILADMQGGYSTLYVRRSFDVAAPAALESITLHVLFDDGYVAYLNGVEVARRNVPGAAGTPLPHDAVTANPVEPPVLDEVDLTARRDLIVPGRNLLALHGLNRAVDNPDFSLDPWLTATVSTGGARRSWIPVGATWSYRRGKTAPPAGWNGLGFDASGWESGPAGFGYGDGDDATVLADMGGSYVTVAIRTTFEVADPSLVTSFELTVDYDDGFAAWINGVEVARSNVRDTAYDVTASSSHEAGSPESFPLDADIDLLVPGTNVIALQGHNARLTSSDFSLSPSLTARIDTGGNGPPDPPPSYAPAPRDIVINEIFPGGVGTGWAELYNPSPTAVDVSGRHLRLFPASSGDFAIPAGTRLPPGGFLLWSESELGFELDTIGALILATGDGRFIDALNPRSRVASTSSGRWPDGADNRRVFSQPTPGAPNRAASERRIVIDEIMYHPAPDNPAGEWIELRNVSAEPVDLTGWAFTRGITWSFLAGPTLAAGGYLIVAADPAAVEARYGITGVLGPYTGRLANDAETIVLRDALGNEADRVRYADEGSWPEPPDGLGPSAELVHPALDNRYGPAWAASAGEGTPGAPNSAFDPDPAPVVAGVEHAPVIPRSWDPVRVLASVSDETGPTRVRLWYQLDSAGGPASVDMLDDGVGDDGIAGNGIWGAEIPPQADGEVVVFWVEATAPGNQVTTAPPGAPDPGLLYQVEDRAPAALRPIYRVIMRAADLDRLRSRSTSSNTLLDLTFVANGRAYYNRGIRNRGSSARHCNPLSYRIQFDHDVALHGIKRLNINGCNAHQQWIGLDFLRRTGIRTPVAWLRSLAFNGQVENGVRLRVEAIDDQFLTRTHPGDNDGNLYRGVSRANLDYRGENARNYRNHYIKVTNQLADDYRDVFDLCFRFDSDTTSAQDFPAAVEERVDVGEWTLFFAAFAVLGSTENSILLNNGDDYFLYHRFSDDRWELFPWDLDSCFDEANQRLFRPSVAAIERFLQHPRYAPDYWCWLEHLLDSAFREDRVQARIDRIEALFSAGRIQSLRSFVPARRAYILARLRPELSVNIDAGATECDGVLVPSAARIDLSGTAPGCGATEVLVAGQAASFDPLSGAWSISVDPSGNAVLDISVRSRDGLEVARREYPLSGTVAPTVIPATISAPTLLAAADSPFLAPADVFVQAGASLAVEAGARIELADGVVLRVAGRLVADGTEADPVQLVGEACASSWGGILFLPGSQGNLLRHARISGLRGVGSPATGIVVDGADLALEATTLGSVGATLLGAGIDGRLTLLDSTLGPGAEGIRLDGGSLSSEGSVLTGIAGAAISGTARPSGPITLSRTTLESCGSGLQVRSASATIRECLLTDIAARALEVSAGSGDVGATVIRDCAVGLAAVDGGRITASHATLWRCATGLLLAEETAGAGGGSLAADSSIVWDTPIPVDSDPASDLELSFSTTSGALQPGPGNLDLDPRFRDPSRGDLRLRATSPCRARGKGGSDMGAFPYEIVGRTTRFLRCDANGDGSTDISDAIHSLLRLFAGGPPASCRVAADCNGDRTLDVSDAIFQLAHLFTGGPRPPAPYPDCEEAEVEECVLSICVTSP